MADDTSITSSRALASRVVGRKFLITGASGFIGSHLCQRLWEAGANVHAISRKPCRGFVDGVHWCQGDLAEEGTVMNIVSSIKPEIIIHLAACVTGRRELEFVLPTLRDNLVSTVNLLTAAVKTGCDRIVLAGSLEEPDPDQRDAVPCSPYAASKWSACAYGRMFSQLFGLPVVIARLFMTYGPAQLDLNKLIPYVTLSLLRGTPPRLTDGSRPVDWIYIDDVVNGLVAISQASAVEDHTIDIGSGTLVSINTVVKQLVDLVGAPVEPLFGALPDRPYERIRAADLTCAQAKLAWKPEISLKEGLVRTIAWYRQQQHAGGLTIEMKETFQ